jgi:hypothetical protein
MSHFVPRPSRLGFLGVRTLGAEAFRKPGTFDRELARTPSVPEGPFDRSEPTLDTDNEPPVVNDGIAPALAYDHTIELVLHQGHPAPLILVKIDRRLPAACSEAKLGRDHA